jgi:hypothetical protein
VSALLDAALAYAARAWPVLACRPRGKTPLLEHGLHDATLDPDQIRAWWARHPAANVGLRTGVAFDVLDVDGPAGESALNGALPDAEAEPVDGPTVATGRGWHVYLAPTGRGNRAGVVVGVDWRGAGGYVVAPPSIHPRGATYPWELETAWQLRQPWGDASALYLWLCHPYAAYVDRRGTGGPVEVGALQWQALGELGETRDPVYPSDPDPDLVARWGDLAGAAQLEAARAGTEREAGTIRRLLFGRGGGGQ